MPEEEVAVAEVFLLLCAVWLPRAVQREGKCSAWGQLLQFRDRGWQCTCIQRMCQNPAVLLQPQTKEVRQNLGPCPCSLHWLTLRSAQEQEFTSRPEEQLSFSSKDWYLRTQFLDKHRPLLHTLKTSVTGSRGLKVAFKNLSMSFLEQTKWKGNLKAVRMPCVHAVKFDWQCFFYSVIKDM